MLFSKAPLKGAPYVRRLAVHHALKFTAAASFSLLFAGAAFARDIPDRGASALGARLWHGRSKYLAGAVCLAVSALMLAPLVLGTTLRLEPA